MRILLALSVIIISIQYGRCKLELKRDKEVIVDIDSPELHQSQYHTADFDTSAYNYGYAVEPNGQFHHETRGGDGVTYGCYGYIDSDDLLKVTHYVADSQGYRTLEHEKPVLVYPINENNVDANDKPYKPKGVMLGWKDLYFPIGCGMARGGVLLNAPVIRAPGGIFQQLGETKFPVQPSHEPKVVIPRIPFDSGIKTEPTKLIPVSSPISPGSRQPDTKTTVFRGVHPITENTQRQTTGSSIPTKETTERPTIRSSIPTKSVNIESHFGGHPEHGTDLPYRQNQQPTIPPTASSSSYSSRSGTFGTSPSPFRESVKVIEPTTVKVPSDTSKLETVTSVSTGSTGQSDYTEELLPPFRTTIFADTQTTIGVPLNRFDPGNDLNVINSYANLNPETRPTTPTTPKSYVEKISATVPTIPTSHPYSYHFSNNAPSTSSTFGNLGFNSTEKISTLRPSTFNDGFTFNTQTTTGTPFDLVTEAYSESTNPDVTTISTTADAESYPKVDLNGPSTNQHSRDPTYQTSFKFSSSQREPSSPAFGVSSSISSQHPTDDGNTTPNDIFDAETTTSQSTYPGIGDYNKPPAGFEFNIPTKAPNQVFSAVSTPTTPQSFVTISKFDTTKDDVPPKTSVDDNVEEDEDPSDDKTIPFTNGPHGAEYQLGTRNPHTTYTVSHGRDNTFNFLNPIKQSRKDTDPPVSLITPLTHLTISGTYPSKENLTTNSIGTSESTQFDTNPSTVQQPTTPIHSDRSPEFGSHYSVSEVNNRQTVQPVRVVSQPNSPPSFPATVTTPNNEPVRGLITHMNAISQTRFQSSRVTPALTSVTPKGDQTSNDVILNQPAVNYFNPEGQQGGRADATQPARPTEFPFLYTRSRTATPNDNDIPYQPTPGSQSPDDKLTIYSGFGQKVIPGVNPATTSFTAYNPGSTSSPIKEGNGISPPTDQGSGFKSAPYDNLPYQPKFVLRPTGRPATDSSRRPLSNFNGYPGAEQRNANFYPDSSPPKGSDQNNNNIQPESKYVNTKKEFVPQYNPSSTPIPGSLGTAIGVYPPNVEDLSPEIPNFSIAISKWPFYILPFPFPLTNDGNVVGYPFLNGLPFQLGGAIGGGVLGGANFNAGTNVNSGNDYVQSASSVGGGGNGAPAQTICSWLNSFSTPKVSAANTVTPTNENGETLEISNLQVNVKNPQLQVSIKNPQLQVSPLSQNQIPFGIVGFIPIIAVPIQYNSQVANVDPAASQPSIQVPSLCTQLSQLFGTHLAPSKDTKNQQLPT